MIENNKVLYFILLSIISILYLRFQTLNNFENVKKNYIQSYEFLRLLLLIIGVIIIPLVSYFKFSEYNIKINENFIIIPIILITICALILINIYNELGKNYSFTLQIKNDHKLIKTGMYKYIRHPMYLVLILFGISQMLFLPNKIGILPILFIIPLFLYFRIKGEEKMLLNTFGEEYKQYIKESKMIIPFIL
jgi:protein-S-isoprenylcysteine O-methyltransferase Ste14